ncbi:MAG TPA: acyltransferase [Planctomycetaceae bacterium]|jgi:peptidoglycan/LPS O-acetylase OafA/YrhL
MQQPTGGFEGRATYIDALRGIAALGVAFYHIARYGPLNDRARLVLPAVVLEMIDHGWVGVQVFFVISGFVIAYSVRNARVTPGFLANYALRRAVRLDPPYWTTIAFVLLLHAFMHLHLGWESPLDVKTKFEPGVSWRLIGSHLIYAQNIIPGYDNLSVGFWTLCIEVQFYLLYVTGMGIAQRLPARDRRTPADAGAWGLLLTFAPLALLSLFEWNRTQGGREVYDNDMWIIRFFCMFFLGASAWWALDQRIPRAVFWLYVAAFCGRIAQQALHEKWSDDLTIGLSAALLAGLSTYLAGVRGCLGTWLNFRVLQYLGRISYSLYLIHFPMSHIVKWVGTWLSGDSPAPIVAACWLALSVVFSILAAHVMYTFIEAPSVRLAAWLKRT